IFPPCHLGEPSLSDDGRNPDGTRDGSGPQLATGGCMRPAHTLLVVGLALGVAGCASAPKTEIDEAKHALETAQNAHAADYAPEAWNAAKDAEAKLDAELAAQDQ